MLQCVLKCIFFTSRTRSLMCLSSNDLPKVSPWPSLLFQNGKKAVICTGFVVADAFCCFVRWGNSGLSTLLNERPVHNPNGTVKCRGSGCTRLGGILGSHCLYSVQHKDEDTDDRDRRGDASPHRKVKGSKEGKDIDLLFRLLDEDAYGIIHVALAEVDDALPFWRDSDSRDGQVSSLSMKTERTVRPVPGIWANLSARTRAAV